MTTEGQLQEGRERALFVVCVCKKERSIRERNRKERSERDTNSKNKLTTKGTHRTGFTTQENEEQCASFHAYNLEAWKRCNNIGDYDRSGDNR